MLGRLLKSAWGRRCFLTAGIVIFVGTGLFCFYLPGYTRLKKLRNKNKELHRRIDNLKKDVARLKEDLDRLDKDPSLWEELARKNLGVVRKGEIVVDIKK